METKTCPVCKAQFARPSNHSLAKWTARKTCSRRCSSELGRRQYPADPESQMRRFWAKVNRDAGKGPDGECWEWTGFKDRFGYGSLRVSGKIHRAHRLSFENHHRELAAGEVVLHRCDNPSCVRPDHLRAGSHAENMADMAQKGRSGAPRGEKHYSSILSVEDVRIILSSKEAAKTLAKKFGVKPIAIYHVRSGKNWGHVSLE